MHRFPESTRPTRRHWLTGLAMCLATASLWAAPYPEKPIRVIVPYPAGGNTDIIAREVMKTLSPRLGQAIVVDNKPGANSILGTEIVAKASPDGYTLGVVIGAFANNASLYRKLPYRQGDLVPVSQLTRTSLVLVSALPGVHSTTDLVKTGQGKGEPLSFASSGIGSAAHLLGERMGQVAHLPSVMHVPYKGTADATTDLVSGRVGFMFDAISAMGPQIRQGKLKALAVTGQSRSPLLPEVPSVKELGYPDLVAYAWAGVIAPPGTPSAIVNRLSSELAATLQEPEIRAKLAAISTEAVGSTPAEFADFLAMEQKVNGELIRKLNISLD